MEKGRQRRSVLFCGAEADRRGAGRRGGRQGEGAVFDGPAGSSVPMSTSSPAPCCPLGVTERTSAGPFLNVQKKVQVYGEGRKL